ncbi:MAG: hypothetical protein ACI9BD_001564, partial [Candidatus Marinamargulisbacteria bacterium]
MLTYIYQILTKFRVPEVLLPIAGQAILIVLFLALSWFSNFFAKRYLLSGLGYLVSKTKSRWDNLLFER